MCTLVYLDEYNKEIGVYEEEVFLNNSSLDNL